MSLLIRDIDDPFGYQAAHNEGMLVAERALLPSLSGAFFTASSIDFAIVFATFGARLHKDLRARDVDVRAIYSAKASGRKLAGAGAAGADDGGEKGDAGNLLRPEVFAAMDTAPRV